MQNNDYLVTFSSIIIDDVLLWTGEISLGHLGGSAHTAAGCVVWWDKVAIATPVGVDDYGWITEKLASVNIDTSGITTLNKNTLRSWDIYHPDETRIQIPRMAYEYEMDSLPDFETLPELFSKAAGYHVYTRKAKELLTQIKQINPHAAVVLEPSGLEKDVDAQNYYSEVLPMVDVFSPNLKEGETITGEKEPREMINTLLRWGAHWVIIRMGDKGSLSGTSDGTLLEVPAAPAKVVDVTGAGNSYMGGLVCGMVQARTIEACLAMAAVSASFTIEQYGIARPNNEERDRRFQVVLEGIVTKN